MVSKDNPRLTGARDKAHELVACTPPCVLLAKDRLSVGDASSGGDAASPLSSCAIAAPSRARQPAGRSATDRMSSRAAFKRRASPLLLLSLVTVAVIVSTMSASETPLLLQTASSNASHVSEILNCPGKGAWAGMLVAVALLTEAAGGGSAGAGGGMSVEGGLEEGECARGRLPRRLLRTCAYEPVQEREENDRLPWIDHHGYAPARRSTVKHRVHICAQRSSEGEAGQVGNASTAHGLFC